MPLLLHYWQICPAYYKLALASALLKLLVDQLRKIAPSLDGRQVHALTLALSFAAAFVSGLTQYGVSNDLVVMLGQSITVAMGAIGVHEATKPRGDATDGG